MVLLSPIVKLDDKNTFDVLRVAPTKFSVVRMQDVIGKDTLKPNATFHKIVKAGGLHNYLQYSNPIILSSIMKDDVLARFGPEDYAMLIDYLQPDAYTTIDGSTYHKEYHESLSEIRRIHDQTGELIKMCPKQIPIGLVKGCTVNQIEYHLRLLKSLGIEVFAFHIGDFMRHGDPNMIRMARYFSSVIKRRARFLMLLGMGSQKRFLEFSFADAYVTFTHFVTALNGVKFVGTKKVKYTGGYESHIAVENFCNMHRNLFLLEHEQKRLITRGGNEWVEESEVLVQM